MIMVQYQRGNMHFSRELGGTSSALHHEIGFDPIPRSARRGDVMSGKVLQGINNSMYATLYP
jgi:hypothetical protein